MIGQARWTHVALPVGDLDASLAFYSAMTPLVVVQVRRDASGGAAWLSNEGQWETPFVLVLSDLDRTHGRPRSTLAPFAHLGIEVGRREEVDEIADRGRAAGCLHWEPRDVPPPVGYVCALRDPDGNVVEFSHDQGVFDAVRSRWAPPAG
jgi:catechol 2,3-dioxygenase-like lactoylglutathione lyase family enzyme